MGTDFPARPHAEGLNDLTYVDRLGMASEDVWLAATVKGAELIGRPDLGVIAPGRRADIIAIRDDVTHFDDRPNRITRV